MLTIDRHMRELQIDNQFNDECSALIDPEHKRSFLASIYLVPSILRPLVKITFFALYDNTFQQDGDILGDR